MRSQRYLSCYSAVLLCTQFTFLQTALQFYMYSVNKKHKSTCIYRLISIRKQIGK